jgi:mono/diheme cytochrome c family protein
MRRPGLAVLAAGFLLAAGAVAAEPLDPALGDPERGAEIYAVACASCHGATGRGDGPVGRALDPPLAVLFGTSYRLDADGDGRPGTREDLRLVLLNGAPAYGGSRLMAAFPRLAAEPGELADVLAFVTSQGRP